MEKAVLYAYNTTIKTGREIDADDYSHEKLENYEVPIYHDGEKVAIQGIHSLHIDGVKWSQFLRDKFVDKVNYLDDTIETVVGNINHLITKNGMKLEADIFIDASGLKRVLMQSQSKKFHKAKEMLMDRALPYVVPNNHDYVPPYTHAVAHEAGWMWEIPIGNRFGTGFVYSSRHMSDEQAKESYKKLIQERHGIKIKPERIIEFNAGYYKNPWTNNVVPIGLASGFLEPLEATNIHMMISQIRCFVQHWHGQPTVLAMRNYNRKMETMWQQAIGFVRTHYHTKRTEPLWQELRENAPEYIWDIKDVCENSFFTPNDMPFINDEWQVFGYSSYAKVLFGKKWLDKQKALEFLMINGAYDDGEQRSKYFKELKGTMSTDYLPHKVYLDLLRDPK
jgi:tryptophan halogenase